MKICKNCKIEKEYNEFRTHKLSGLLNTCIVCEKKRDKEYRESLKPLSEKICLKCNELKPFNKFYTYQNRGREMYKKYCLDCYKPAYKQEDWNEIKSNKDKEYNSRPEVKERKTNNRKENKEEINRKYREYITKRKIEDPIFALSLKIRKSLLKSFRNKGIKKNTKTEQILGCSYDNFKIYIESQFESWMSWENRGKYNGEYNFGWDIDHIINLETAKTEEEVINLNHYTNLRPLCSKVNRDELKYYKNKI